MFIIHKIKNQTNTEKSIEIMNKDKSSYAKIVLNLGGSLQKLSLNNKSIIIDMDELDYSITYSSAILFPFANRIKDGKYTFENKHYTLNLNEAKEKNAIHGLVYDKTFKYIKQKTSADYASITIGYNETKRLKGFPFKYSIYLTYTLKENSLTLEAKITNNDIKSFPFNIGWHPYFTSKNLHNSFLNIKSNKKFIFDRNMIPTKTQEVNINKSFQIKNTHFDDCFVLNKNNIGFKTPNYNIKISSSSKENYLQIYTPKNIKNTIAIEPVTGPVNSFNNKLGLQTLAPNETYKVSWSIKLENND